MPNKRDLNLRKYGISKARYKELYNWCLQYKEWRDRLENNTHALKGQQITGMPFGGGVSDSTANLAIKREYWSKECELLEQTVIEAVGEVWEDDCVDGNMEKMFTLMIKAIVEDYRYTYMDQVLDIPCSRDKFNDIRRYFYFLLSEKKSQ